MNYLPLPDELLRKVIQYIHPIFEYQKFYKNLNYYKETSEDLDNSVYNEGSATADLGNNISRCIEHTEEIASLSCLRLEYLREINDFVKTNPIFENPSAVPKISENKYKMQFEQHINKRKMVQLEGEIVIHRGMWHNPDERGEICVFDDINVLHSTGTIRDLIFACIMNNMRGWKTSFNDFMMKKYFINTAITPVKEIHYIRFINYYYSDNAIRENMAKRIPKRSTLIRKLMRL